MLTIRNDDGSIGLSAGGQYEDGAPAQLGPTASTYAPTVAPTLVEAPVAAPPESGVTIIPSGNTVGGRGIVLDAPPEPDARTAGAARDGGITQAAPLPSTGAPRSVPTSASLIEGGPATVATGPAPASGRRMLWASAAIVGGVFVLVALAPRRRG